MDSSIGKNDHSELLELIQKLENRISKIESAINLTPQKEHLTGVTDEESKINIVSETEEEREEKLEFKIGQSWLAFIGTTVLIIGLCFLLSFSYESLPIYLPSVIGYGITVLLFVLSHRIRQSYQNISGYLLGGSMILLYFSTLRFYLFGNVAAIQSNTAEVILLSMVVIIDVSISFIRKSFYLICVSLTLGLITSVINHESFYLYFVVSLVALFGIYLRLHYKWTGVVMYLMPVTYLTHLVWYFVNTSNTYRTDYAVPQKLDKKIG